jgi:hypothetical protein
MTKTKNTVTDFKAELEAAGIKLAPLCGHISSLEAGSMQSVSENGKKLAQHTLLCGARVFAHLITSPQKARVARLQLSNGRSLCGRVYAMLQSCRVGRTGCADG